MVAGVAELGSYAWTGHAGMLGKHKQDWHSVREALQFFGDTPRRARVAYLNFPKEGESNRASFSGGGLVRSHGGWQGLEQFRGEHETCIGDERILGSSHFVESALCQDELSTQLQTKLVRQGWDIHRLSQKVQL